MSRRWSTLLVVGVILVGAWAFYRMSAWASRGGEQAPLYSVRRHDPYGAAALFELLNARDIQVDTLQRSRPPRGSHGTVIQILPARDEEDDDLKINWQPQLHADSLRKWIVDGNTVVQFTSHRTALMELCGIPMSTHGLQVPADWEQVEREMRRGSAPHELEWHLDEADWLEDSAVLLPAGLKQAGPLTFHAAGQLHAQADSNWLPLASWRGDTVVGMQRVRKGRLIVVASPTPVLNGTIQLGGNLDMILAIVGEQPVLFDEWSHGFGHGGTVMGLIRRVGLLPSLLQLLLAIAVYVWSTMGYRRSQIEITQRKRSSVEQIATLGHLYNQVLGVAQVRQRTHNEVQRRLAKAMRCSISGLPERLQHMDNRLAERAQAILTAFAPSTAQSLPRCQQCGYILAGNQSGKCPECGTQISFVSAARTKHIDAHVDSQASRSRVEERARKLLTETYQLAREISVESGSRLAVKSDSTTAR